MRPIRAKDQSERPKRIDGVRRPNGKSDLAPILKERPGVATDLAQILARRTAGGQERIEHSAEKGFAAKLSRAAPQKASGYCPSPVDNVDK